MLRCSVTQCTGSVRPYEGNSRKWRRASTEESNSVTVEPGAGRTAAASLRPAFSMMPFSLSTRVLRSASRACASMMTARPMLATVATRSDRPACTSAVWSVNEPRWRQTPGANSASRSENVGPGSCPNRTLTAWVCPDCGGEVTENATAYVVTPASIATRARRLNYRPSRQQQFRPGGKPRRRGRGRVWIGSSSAQRCCRPWPR